MDGKAGSAGEVDFVTLFGLDRGERERKNGGPGDDRSRDVGTRPRTHRQELGILEVHDQPLHLALLPERVDRRGARLLVDEAIDEVLLALQRGEHACLEPVAQEDDRVNLRDLVLLVLLLRHRL